ncbi:MAG TPA: aspartyl protease family protein [Chitinophagaceae bacterium]|nr:aspartyl protease family protein [Chitinophagaceae bacterium]
MLFVKKWLLILFCFTALLQQTSYAQEEFIVPSKFLTKFDFKQLTGGVVMLKARFATFPDTLNFILDTGSGGISLDSVTTRYFGLNPTPSDRTIRGIGGIKNVGFLNNQKIHLPGLTVDSLNFHVNDYEILTAVYGEKIDGIIGYSILSRYIVKLNYDSSKIEFWTKGALKYPRGGYLMRPLITTLPVTQTRIRDDKAINSRFLYDMGAGLCMMLSTDFIKDSALLDKKRKLYAKEAEGLGGKIDMNMTVIKEVRLGPYKFKNVPVFVFDDTYNITSYPYLGGLIGNDLLRRFNVILNYDKRDIYLMPNKHFGEPFDYSYSGIELYFVDGIVIVGDVAKGSPAEAAGLKEGDEVLGINKTFGRTLQLLKTELQNTGNKVKMIVSRDGELREFEFKIKSIMH